MSRASRRLACPNARVRRGLENAIARHSGGSGGSSGSFGGKGQTLGGSSSSTPVGVRAGDAAAGLTNLDPQVKVFFGLVAAYAFLYYMFYM